MTEFSLFVIVEGSDCVDAQKKALGVFDSQSV